MAAMEYYDKENDRTIELHVYNNNSLYFVEFDGKTYQVLPNITDRYEGYTVPHFIEGICFDAIDILIKKSKPNDECFKLVLDEEKSLTITDKGRRYNKKKMIVTVIVCLLCAFATGWYAIESYINEKMYCFFIAAFVTVGFLIIAAGVADNWIRKRKESEKDDNE